MEEFCSVYLCYYITYKEVWKCAFVHLNSFQDNINIYTNMKNVNEEYNTTLLTPATSTPHFIPSIYLLLLLQLITIVIIYLMQII
jgi:hypothetical protein